MSVVEILGDAPRLSVRGMITFSTVMPLKAQGEALIRESENEQLQFDLSQVNYADSSALALLFAWQRSAKRAKKTLLFTQIPASMMHLSRLCSVDALINHH